MKSLSALLSFGHGKQRAGIEEKEVSQVTTGELAGKSVQVADVGTGEGTVNVVGDRGHHHAVGGKRLGERHASQGLEALRLRMRDARDSAKSAVAGGNTRAALDACRTLQKLSLSAQVQQDDALCNGGLMGLSEIGSLAVSHGNEKVGRHVARCIAAVGTASIKHHKSSCLVSAQHFLASLFSAAQDTSKGVAAFARSEQLDLFTAKGGSVRQALIEVGQDGIENDNIKAVKDAIVGAQAYVTQAERLRYPEKLRESLQALERLEELALEQGDIPLANTIPLQYKELIADAVRRDSVDGLISITASLNRMSAKAEEQKQRQIPALVRYLYTGLLEQSRNLSGGMTTFLTHLPLQNDVLLDAAKDTLTAAQESLQAKDTARACEMAKQIADISKACMRRGVPEQAVETASMLGELGKEAAALHQVGVLEQITTSITEAGDFAARAGYTSIASSIATVHSRFESAWDVARKHTAS